MAGILVNEGEKRIADIILGSQAVDATLYMGLYTNAVQPSETATLSDITEVSGTGYARKALTRTSWTGSADAKSYAEQTFGAAGTDWGTVTGYFIATSSDNSGKLMIVESFPAGIPIGVGSSQSVTPTVTFA